MEIIERAKLEKILPRVVKPGRYINQEWNSIHKDNDSLEVKVALAFPDVYEIGMSNLGLRILYYILNKKPNILAERVYAPWVDMREIMKKERIPLFSLESRRALRDFDLIGFSLQSELTYTNVLDMLDLAGIPFLSRKRDESYPLIIAGGPCTCNPEPLADFIDLFFIGEAEEAILELVDVFQVGKKSRENKEALLRRMARIEGVYVPSLYGIHYNPNGTIGEIRPSLPEAPPRIKRRIVDDLDKAEFPTQPLLPFIDIVHDRITLEILRGCTRGCRFCQAGMIYRPVRERQLETLLKLAKESLRNSGYEEISLSSLSSSDHSCIQELVRRFIDTFGKERIAISLSSLRIDSFSVELAQQVERVKKTGLTFAPEAGTERLRRVINKVVSDEDLLATISSVYRAGWGLVKLYFMIGLPTEREEDLKGIVDLVRRIVKKGREVSRRAVQVNVSLSPFVPKPHTPFQWEGLVEIKELKERQSRLKRSLSLPEVSVKWHQVEASLVEAALARGDRRLGEVIRRAWGLGCIFDGWSDRFNYNLWCQAFSQTGLDLNFYAHRQRGPEEIFPWDHIDTGVEKDYLLAEHKKAIKGESTPDCREGGCTGCGACPGRKPGPVSKEKERVALIGDKELSWRPQAEPVRQRIRVQYTKEPELKFISHLDLARVFSRAVRRARIPIAYSGGFSPHPRISFGPPLSLGFTSKAEYADFSLTQPLGLYKFTSDLERELPSGIRLLQTRLVTWERESLMEQINVASYRVKIRSLDLLSDGEEGIERRIRAFLGRQEVIVDHWTKKRYKRLDIRPALIRLNLDRVEGDLIELSIILKIGNEGGARLSELLKALFDLSPEILPQIKVEREGLYILSGSSLFSPLDFSYVREA